MVKSANSTNYVADGVVLPVPLAGDPALELCNTFAGWGESAGREYLLSYEHLVVWARERGVVARGRAQELLEMGRQRRREGEVVVERAKLLRSAFYAVATGEGDAASRARVADEVEAALVRSRVAWQPEPATLALPTALELPVWAAAQRIGEFVTAPKPVGRCPGRGCGWLFTNAGGRRRWCTMAVCGNRAKVRRHAQRTRASDLEAARLRGPSAGTAGGDEPGRGDRTRPFGGA